MDFETKIRPKGQITIPLKLMEYNDFQVGEVVKVSVIKKSTVEQLKRNLEKNHRSD